MPRKRIRHLDFSTLVLINREAVSLTGERHEYSEEDGRRLRAMLDEVAAVSNDEELDEAVIQKTALLVYRIASGQHFHEGNKRTALVAAAAFLQMNGHSIDLRNEGLVSLVDRTGMATATLNDVRDLMRRLIKIEPERTSAVGGNGEAYRGAQ